MGEAEDRRGRAVVLDVARVGELERAIEAAGTSLATLMARAGEAVANAVRGAVPEPCAVAVLAGSGNNGGDGWVAAERLAEAGYSVTLATMAAATALRAEPARAAALSVAARAADGVSGDAGRARGANRLRILEAPSVDEVAATCSRSRVVVDALLGTGFSGNALRDPVGAWVEAANAARKAGALVVAADVPSGLSAQTGVAARPCVEADETVTMLALKPGLLALGAVPYVGRLTCAPLGIDVCRDFPEFA